MQDATSYWMIVEPYTTVDVYPRKLQRELDNNPGILLRRKVQREGKKKKKRQQDQTTSLKYIHA